MQNKSRYKGCHAARQALRDRMAMEQRPCWICDMAIPYGLREVTHPRHFEVDELTPYSRGGSTVDPGNTAPAHRCCNNWRSNRSVAEVNATKAAIVKAYGGWSSPEDFVAKAKALKGKKLVARSKPTTTTEW